MCSVDMTMFGAMHGGGGTLSLKAESLDPRTWMQQQQAIPQMQDQPGLVDFFNFKGAPFHVHFSAVKHLLLGLVFKK